MGQDDRRAYLTRKHVEGLKFDYPVRDCNHDPQSYDYSFVQPSPPFYQIRFCIKLVVQPRAKLFLKLPALQALVQLPTHGLALVELFSARL